MELPSGTVTLLATDIEGSTPMMEQEPEAMMRLLAQHDSILRACIEKEGGVLFKSLGDGVYAAFSDAASAVQAALQAHHQLDHANWAPFATLKVRMALHISDLQPYQGDYTGVALARLARLRDAAHGGQILLTHAAVNLVQDHLPQGVSLEDLGVVPLRGLQRPEHVFQLRAPNLPADFPPLRGVAIPSKPSSLPLRLTTYIERPNELPTLMQELAPPAKNRLITLTGPGGCGKTRLALELGYLAAPLFPDGVWWVELASLQNPQLLPSLVLSSLGLKETSEATGLQLLQREFLGKQLLLILDCCEHLIEETAGLVMALLQQADGLQVLATSRVPFGIHGEKTWPVHPFSVPKKLSSPLQMPSTEGKQIAGSEVIHLWLDRAQAADPQFQLTPINAPTVLEICRILDGIPLAIELAAARVATFPLEQMHHSLQESLQLLSGRGASYPYRHRSMENTIRWSYDMLSPHEQEMLQFLSVFTGEFSLEAFEGIYPAENKMEAIETLLGLVEKSFVVFESGLSQGRYRLLEPLRLFAAQELAQSGKALEAQNRFLEYYLQRALVAAAELGKEKQAQWLVVLDEEYGHFRAALRYAVNPLERLQLATALSKYWYIKGWYSEGRSWLEGALLRAANASPTLRADALNATGLLAWAQGDSEKARFFYSQALELALQQADSFREAQALNGLALIAQKEADYSLMRQYLENGLHSLQKINHPSAIQVLVNLGGLCCELGDYPGARAYFEQALPLLKELGHTITLLIAYYNLGEVYRNQQEFPMALQCYRESLQILRQYPANPLYPRVLDSVAEVAFYGYDAPETAASLLGMARAGLEDVDASLVQNWELSCHELKSALIKRLSPPQFEALYMEGQKFLDVHAIEEGIRQIDFYLNFAKD